MIPNLSRYHLTSDVSISSGVTLTINSGVEVNTDDSFDDIVVDGTLAGTGVSFTGNETDILVRNGGRAILVNGTSVAGDEVRYESGSLGAVECSTVALELVLDGESNVSVFQNDLSSATVRATGSSSAQIDLTSQYWGTTVLSEIESRIEHKADDSGLPIVLFDPPLSSAPLPCTSIDFGDAPTSYGTTLASNGARHLFGDGTLFLGVSKDFEADGQPTVGADGDDVSGIPDDEDGVAFGELRQGNIAAPVTVISSAVGLLNGFIDLPRPQNLWVTFHRNPANAPVFQAVSRIFASSGFRVQNRHRPSLLAQCDKPSRKS